MRGNRAESCSTVIFERGFTLVELLVALLVSATVLLGAAKLYSAAMTTSHDQKIRTETLIKAQSVLQMIGNELRVLGNGVPFDQSNFQIGELGTYLTDDTLAEPVIVATSTASAVSFRLNETGEVKLLAQDFDPIAGSTVYLTDVDTLDVNDPIYISNGTVGENDGLYGVIASVNTSQKSVSLSSKQFHNETATFKMGSIFEEVPVVTWQSDSVAGVTRNSGFGAVVVGDNSTFQLEYLKEDGSAVALPLTHAKIINELRSIRVTVVSSSPIRLMNGQPYSVTARHTFGIRNLNILY